MKTINAEELKKKLDAGKDFILIDVLSKSSFDVWHIPSSISLPRNEIEEKAAEVLPDKNAEIVVYCASTDCMASPQAARKLDEMGYTNVTDYEAGVAGWKDAGYKLEGDTV